ncbi:hypothetical protein BJ508DRAFT_180687 [Ascobolus immersus RN42]|uniref:Uncharacterized protein n=1 Tax=Ascobolus immersus RN42 TaxID=1160509 RepID=A0A3N4I4T7_ASCIM|nr:hypothetical protein BJ508DRAFT_180687 [Ascobolus immersus RN42]
MRYLQKRRPRTEKETDRKTNAAQTQPEKTETQNELSLSPKNAATNFSRTSGPLIHPATSKKNSQLKIHIAQ